MKSRRKGRETGEEEQELRAEGVRGAAGGAGRERPGSQKGGQLRAAAVRLVGRQCRADLVVRASTSPLLHLPTPPLRLLLLLPRHPLHPELTVPRARASGQGQGLHDPLRPQVPAAAHGRARVTSLAVDADGAPRPGYVTLPSSRRRLWPPTGSVVEQGERLCPRSRQRPGRRSRASGSGAVPRCWCRGDGKYRAAVRDTWPGLKARRVFRCSCPQWGGALPWRPQLCLLARGGRRPTLPHPGPAFLSLVLGGAAHRP